MSQEASLTSSRHFPQGKLHTSTMQGEQYQWENDKMEVVTLPYGGTAHLACRHEHVRTVLTDRSFSRALANSADKPRLNNEVLPKEAVLALDPPEHTQIRRAISARFNLVSAEKLRPKLRNLLEQRITGLPPKSECYNVISQLIAPYTVGTMGIVLGMREESIEDILQASAILRERDADEGLKNDARKAIDESISVEIGRRHPRETFFQSVARELHETETSHPYTANLGVALLLGGIGSPTTFLSSSLHFLLTDPGMWSWYTDRNRSKEDLEQLVDELFRMVPVGVTGGFPRVAKRDVKIGGSTVKAGETVIPCMTAANRDPSVYSNASQFDTHRTGAPPHLAFGRGAHHCVGAPLARVQAEEFFTALRDRLPHLSLAPGDGSVVWRTGLVVRELERMMVRCR